MAYQRVFGRRSGFQPVYARERQVPKQVDFIELVSQLGSPDAMGVAAPAVEREVLSEEREGLFTRLFALVHTFAMPFPTRRREVASEMEAEAVPESNRDLTDLREPTLPTSE